MFHLLELEQSYEIKRTERKNRKSRGRPPKRARRDKEVLHLYDIQKDYGFSDK